MRITKYVVGLVLVLASQLTQAKFEPFVVKDIKVAGLQRIELGTFFTFLPIQVGETLDQARLPSIIRTLNRNGSFQYIKVSREGDALIIQVEERPIISDIIIEGNKQLKTEDLMRGMQGAGFAKGEVYLPAALEAISSEIESQYFANGKYGVTVKTRAVNLSRNRVQVRMDIDEGDAAKIREINIVGNKLFTDEEIREQFELTTGGMFSFFSNDNQYAREKLSGDLEKLRNYYLDRGYLKFEVTSTQVSISPDRKGIYITINVDEGDKFKVSEIKLSGELIFTEEQIKAMIPLLPGDTYNGAAISFAEERIAESLGYRGYAFANVVSVPDIDEDNQEVALTLFVDPKQRTYVRRINFTGNETTDDHVLRRQMRLMEGEALSTQLIERSKVRLEQLAFIEQASVETPKADGTEDQVDVEVNIKERNAGTISGGIGYGNFFGFSVQASVSHENFLGSGNQVAFAINNNAAIQNYNFSYTNPFFTDDGISLGYNVFFRSTDFGQLNISRSSQDSIGAGATFGIPIDEVSQISYGATFLSNQLSSFARTGAGGRSENLIELFQGFGLDPFSNQDLEFELVELRTGWQRNTLNRGIFPDSGTLNSLLFEASVPGSDLEYYKINYNLNSYFRIADGWSFRTAVELSWGDGYGDGIKSRLPYFENFFNSFNQTLRGFEQNTVGPREIIRTPSQGVAIDIDGNPVPILLPPTNDTIQFTRFSTGGNARATASFELIFPLPLVDNNRSVRTSFFVDVGNIWDTNFNPNNYVNNTVILPNGVLGTLPDFSDPGTYRVSAGIAVQWLSPLGPISLSIGQPIREQPFDEFENLQFNIGRTF